MVCWIANDTRLFRANCFPTDRVILNWNRCSHIHWPIYLLHWKMDQKTEIRSYIKCRISIYGPQTISMSTVFRWVKAFKRGWSGGAKMLCVLHHWGVQLILAYSWPRPAILVVGKGRGGMFLFLLFLHFHSCSSFFPVSLFHLLYSLFYLFSPFLWETTQNDPQGLTCR